MLVILKIQPNRLWKILSSDPLNLIFLCAQPLLIGLLIGLLVGWVAEDFVLRMFMCVVATLWFGCSNGAQQIVRELPIFQRERVCGLGIHSYIQSKLFFFSGITILQALAVLFFAQLSGNIFCLRNYR
ncbi:MAG: ABC transporter permease [Chthoniobacterales bacterium]|nr:ABC transporter permease [Chthoniobacterales bacterium]